MINNINSIIELIKKSNSTLFILCGLPYSGKTYLANSIIEKTSIDYISIDNILDSLGYDWDTNKLPDELGWKEVMNKSYDMIRSSLANKKNALYDSTNHTLASRNDLRKIASELDCKTVVLFVNTSEEIVRQRWSENKLDPKRFVLDKALLDKTVNDFEAPSEDENVLCLS
ncbi:MAG: ATP-binding protein [Candidatus Falkowbacteria bacterium]|nr:ATP-binding protein [Candidatus Falkowbacteria bacterium]